MRAALYLPLPGDEALAAARAFCSRQGLVPGALYAPELPRDKHRQEQFFAAARRGEFEVLVVPFADCLPTRFLQQLVAAGVGLAVF